MLEHAILLPSKFKTVSEDEKKGIYEIEGLYPGYGQTLGNSLRRIILSSLPGATVIAVKIDGVDHEFDTLEGVKEDVIAILLNLKKLRFKTDMEEPVTVSLKAKGPQVVDASAIVPEGNVEVLNKDQFIAEITKAGVELSIELTVKKGLGYMPREVLFKERVPAGTIALDAAFSPIRKVSYEVENMRVGERTDHNLLRIKIQTDGSITPEEVLKKSILNMLAQLQAILDLKDVSEMIPRVPVEEMTAASDGALEEERAREELADVLKTRIESLNLSTRTSNALSEANIRTVGGLVQKTEVDLLGIQGLGAKGLTEIREALDNFDLGLKG